MGRAKILSGGEDGRYTVELDTGEQQRLALAAAAGQIVAKLTTKLAEDLAELEAEEVKVAAARATLNAAIAAYVSASQGDDQAAKDDALLTYVQAQRLVLFAEGQAGGVRRRVGLIRLKLKQAEGRLAYWQNLSLLETRQAWCADLTENAPPGVEVATLEIPGESGLVLIKPGAPVHNLPVDGDMVAREVMSPEQVFLNAALLPGWQRFKPTFRRGTITALDVNANTANVALADAVSSAQRLDVNQATNLTGVPVTYMSCNASAFKVGDQVVVMFDGQDWESPRVIGFVTDPKGCGWTCYGIDPFVNTSVRTGIFLFANKSLEVAEALFYGLVDQTVTAEFRFETYPGTWRNLFDDAEPIPTNSSTPDPTYSINTSSTRLSITRETFGGYVYVGNGGRHSITLSLEREYPQSALETYKPPLWSNCKLTLSVSREIRAVPIGTALGIGYGPDLWWEFRIRAGSTTLFHAAIYKRQVKVIGGVITFAGEAASVFDFELQA